MGGSTHEGNVSVANLRPSPLRNTSGIGHMLDVICGRADPTHE